MPLDDATLFAWERGYLGGNEDRPSINELLDAISEDLSGEGVYSLHDADAFENWRQWMLYNQAAEQAGVAHLVSFAQVLRALSNFGEVR
jgi:hypothetical protein